ncbi:MAG: hypothetical protein CMH31_03530 [Micavibrio sp.]|nr:hypothetical protein [Micavibrio sp.]|tara:strand:- start:644 stop:979 length:336 start_codon:yes stop_codon:yes gene_type:complete
MIDNSSKDLNDLLKRRYVPEPSVDLSERIITASRHNAPDTRWNILIKEVKSLFVIPRPMMAFASVMIIALLITLPVLYQSPQDIDASATQEYFATVMDDDFIFEAFEISLL